MPRNEGFWAIQALENSELTRHGNAGGLGLAAIQIAAAAGAEVLGTAGSAQKRKHAREAGAAAAASSRTLEFSEVFAAREGRPNVILNSLTSPGAITYPFGFSWKLLEVNNGNKQCCVCCAALEDMRPTAAWVPGTLLAMSCATLSTCAH